MNPEQLTRLADLRRMAATHNAAWKRHASFDRSGAASADVEQQAAIRAECGFDFTNEQRAELETLEFLADPPAACFAYPKSPANPWQFGDVTGFMGNVLARFYWMGRKYRDNFGSERQSFRALGINGVHYHGTIYGTYLRMKRSAKQTS